MNPDRKMPLIIGGDSTAYGSLSAFFVSQQEIAFGGEEQLPLQHEYQQPVDMPLSAANGEDNGAQKPREEEFESGSGGDNVDVTSKDHQQDPNHRLLKKRYRRHNHHQVLALEEFYKDCPHPDDKQRNELSRELGLEPHQVKFWFQNKRTQIKKQQERQESIQLQEENEQLRAECMRYRELLANVSCPNCGGPATVSDVHRLHLEIARLREMNRRISASSAKNPSKPATPHSPHPAPFATPSQLELGADDAALAGAGPGTPGAALGSTSHAELERPLVVELAVAAMEELLAMAQPGPPLWAPAPGGAVEALNEDEYARAFPGGVGPKRLELRTEASRATAVVMMDHATLVQMLMAVDQWSVVFSSIALKVVLLEVLYTGIAGNYDRALQLMSAEFYIPSPMVPSRETQFLRYCKQQSDGTWAIVDVSVDSLRQGPAMRSRRRPSGCLIQEMPNGYSKVIWVEHVEADDTSVDDLYKPLVYSGLAFGAKRWISTLQRQCERIAMAMASNIPSGVVTTPEGRRGVLKLAERMVASFYSGVAASTTLQWTALSASHGLDIRAATRRCSDIPGYASGIILNASTSFWLPASPHNIFEYLQDDAARTQWNHLYSGGIVREIAQIANGRDHGNLVSLFRVNGTNLDQCDKLVLQESCTDASGCHIVFASVENIEGMNEALAGGNPAYIALLPAGIAVLPDGQPRGATDGTLSVGSLLTVAFQVLVDYSMSVGSVSEVTELISSTVECIRGAFVGPEHDGNVQI